MKRSSHPHPSPNPNRARKRTRPRRLVIPALSEDNDSNDASKKDWWVSGQDAYELDPEQFLSLGVCAMSRPLPSMSSLATQRQQHPTSSSGTKSTTVNTGLNMPLLKTFAASIGLKNQTRKSLVSTAAADDDDSDGDDKWPIGVDDHRCTTTGEASSLTDQPDFGEWSEKRHSTAATKTMAAPSSISPPAAPNAETTAALLALAKPPPDSSGMAQKKRHEIDDPRNSTLSRGQHERYMQLLSEVERNGPFMTDQFKNREFRKLRRAVAEERRLYARALMSFRERCGDVFLVGFKVPGPASDFVHTNSHLVAEYRERWLRNSRGGGENGATNHPPPTQYGKCRQAISLGSIASPTTFECGLLPIDHSDANTVGRRKAWPRLNLESFASRVVHATSNEGVDRAKPGWAGCCARGPVRLTPPKHKTSERTIVPLLCKDEIARKLAAEHGAGVVMTHLSFEAILRRPGYGSTRWTIPMSSEGPPGTTTHVVFMEDPVPQPSTPRECLSRGFEAGLYDSLSSAPHDPSSVQYVYSLFTIPQQLQHGQQQPLKVLVRSPNRLLNESGSPIHLHVQLEYIPERGWEEYTSHQRCLWIMSKLLQPDCRVVVGRVNPHTAELVRLEEKSVAHSLAGPRVDAATNLAEDEKMMSGFSFFEPSDLSAHFQGAMDLLRAAFKVGTAGCYVMSLPGKGVTTTVPATSVSVHGEWNETQRQTSSTNKTEDGVGPTVDIGRDLEEAEAVFMGAAVLMGCFRNWTWEKDRVALTFPTKEED